MSDSLKRAVIFGARHDGSAKVVLDIITLGGSYRVVSFLDDEPALWGCSIGDIPVAGGCEALPDLHEQGVEGIAFAVGNKRVRERVLDQARRAGLTPIKDHDRRIGAYASVSPGCHLSGRTVIGRYAFLGTGAITLPDVLIGDDAIVGAGAVVLAAVAPGTTVVGVPARVVRQDGNR